MLITSLCPFKVSTLVWEAQPRQFSLTVAVKATFRLVAGGEAEIADEQEPLSGDRHWDDRPMASLFAQADLAPLKRRVDLALVGHAHAPRGTQVGSLVARFAVGDVFSKSIRVTGDRTWDGAGSGVRAGVARPFSKIPLRYERAPLSNENPVGVDATAPPVRGGLAAANLELADSEGMVGFGPVASTWRARRKRVSDEGLFWAYGFGPDVQVRTGPPPSSFDFAFFNGAPREQQVDLVRPGMSLELDNLHPDQEKLVSSIPAVKPQVFRVAQGATRGEEIMLRCDTLWIDCDRARLVLTFRGIADVGTSDAARLGRLVVTADPHGKKLRWENVERELSGARAPAQPEADDPLSKRYDEVVAGVKEAAIAAAKAMVSQRSPASPTSRPAPRDAESPEPPTLLQLGGARAAVPSNPPRPAPHAMPRPRKKPPPPMPPPRRVEAPASESVLPDPPSDPTQPLASSGAPIGDEEEPTAAIRSDRMRALANDVEPAKPRLLAADSVAHSAAQTPPPVRAIEDPETHDESAGGSLSEEEDATPRMTPIDIGRFAAVSAHLSRRGVHRSAVLRAHGLREADLASLAEQWSRELDVESDAQRREITSAYDAAYVAAQELLEPVIGIDEYARIAVALERGEVGRVLGELSLELADLMRLQRVWTRRASESAHVQALLEAAMTYARNH